MYIQCNISCLLVFRYAQFVIGSFQTKPKGSCRALQPPYIARFGGVFVLMMLPEQQCI